jgi:hypothetical protein
MFRNLSTFMLAAAAALAQAPASPQAALKPGAPAEVPPGTPVMTIHGVCDGRSTSRKDAPCETVVTREEFETVMKVVSATSRTGVPSMRINVAEGYADVVVYANAAKNAGVEQDPRFEKVVQVSRMRAMGDMYRLKRNEAALKVTSAEIQDYYKKNLPGYEELQLRRLTLPRNNKNNLEDLEYRAKATRMATDLRDRAAKGEDMEKLQAEGFHALNVKDPQGTLMAPLRRGAFEAKAEEEIFALKKDQVTSILQTPSVYIVYKLEGRRMLSIDDVRDEIKTKLYHEKLDKQIRALNDSVHVDYNQDYFGASAAQQWVSAGALESGSGKPAPLR